MLLGGILSFGAGLAVSLAGPQNTLPASPPKLHPIEARIIEKTNSQRPNTACRPWPSITRC